MPPRLGRRFFARPAPVVAADLVGCTLVADAGTELEVRAVLVEVEAYRGVDDPASHAYRGPTPRAAIMFGGPGHLYVYLSYGLHHCANLVTDVPGTAGAVLLRAAAVTRGEEVVRRRRQETPRRGEAAGWLRRQCERPPPLTDAGRALRAGALLRGPGNLCRGLGLRLADNGLDVCDHRRLWLADRAVAPPVVAGPRIGVGAARDLALRFHWEGHPAVTRRPA